MTGHEDGKLYFTIIILSLTAGFLACGYRCFRSGWIDDFHRQVVPSDATDGIVAPTSEDSPTVEELETCRKEVLKKIFPVHDGREEGQRVLLSYDIEAQKYLEQNATESNKVESPSCSICLEDFDKSASIVTAACVHSYHAKCILSWVAQRDDCPNCRAGMWDPDEFNRLMKDELANRNGSRSCAVDPNVGVGPGC